MPGAGRRDRAERAAKASRIVSKVVGHEAGAHHLEELAGHLPHLTVAQLRDARVRLMASFGGGRRRGQMVAALLDHVRDRIADGPPREREPEEPKPHPWEPKPGAAGAGGAGGGEPGRGHLLSLSPDQPPAG